MRCQVIKEVNEEDQPMFSPESSDAEQTDSLKESEMKIEHEEIFINDITEIENLPLDIPNQDNLDSVPSIVDEEFKCEKCHKTFHNKSNLSRHVKVKHKEEFPLEIPKEFQGFICEKCNKKFINAFYLKRHFRARHPDVLPSKLTEKLFKQSKRFKCDKCDKNVSNKSNLKRHFRIAHPEVQGSVLFWWYCLADCGGCGYRYGGTDRIPYVDSPL